MSYLEENDLLSNSQFGFRSGRCTEQAATLLTSYQERNEQKKLHRSIVH